jgi:hypothetical protein
VIRKLHTSSPPNEPRHPSDIIKNLFSIPILVIGIKFVVVILLVMIILKKKRSSKKIMPDREK